MKKYKVYSKQDAFQILTNHIPNIAPNSKPYIIGIDGRCGSGKSTVAAMLKEHLRCEVVHIDDFYIPLAHRTPEMMQTPAGHIDLDRLSDDVLLPLSGGEGTYYLPFDCQSQSYCTGFSMYPREILLVEGSYAMHPKLQKFYDLKVFFDIDKLTQKSRIIERGGQGAWRAFETRWIPLEEMYFEAFALPEGCDICLDVQP